MTSWEVGEPLYNCIQFGTGAARNTLLSCPSELSFVNWKRRNAKGSSAAFLRAADVFSRPYDTCMAPSVNAGHLTSRMGHPAIESWLG